MANNCFDKHILNKVMPYELSNDDMAVATIANKPKHIGEMKV